MSAHSDMPLLILVSAPSGAGKTTLCEMLLLDRDDLVYSVSCTTRALRGNEQDGVNYHFISRDAFEAHVAAGDFLEYAEVHGEYYGTLRTSVLGPLSEGKDVLMDIDVQGAGQIREAIKDDPVMRKAFVDIFISPPSVEALERRLRERSEDSDASIERRVKNAENEMRSSDAYSRIIVNDILSVAYDDLKRYIRDTRNSRRVIDE